jgi:hypothetical protein
MRAMLVAAVGATLASACGAFDGTLPAPDPASDASPESSAGREDAAADDASDASVKTRCRWDAPFGPPLQLFAVGSAQDDATPRLTPDELTMYFHSTRTAGRFAIYVSERRSRAEQFRDASLVPLEPMALEKAQPAFNGDASDGLFFEQYDLDGGAHLQHAARTADGGYLPAVRLTGLEPLGETLQPFVRADDLLFAVGRDAKADIFRAKLLMDGGVTAPRPLDEVNTPAYEADPILSNDGETLYFASTRSDGNAKGGADIWRARRNGAGWNLVSNVAELNTSRHDFPAWISGDECRIYLTSTNANGKADMFMAERAP